MQAEIEAEILLAEGRAAAATHLLLKRRMDGIIKGSRAIYARTGRPTAFLDRYDADYRDVDAKRKEANAAAGRWRVRANLIEGHLYLADGSQAGKCRDDIRAMRSVVANAITDFTDSFVEYSRLCESGARGDSGRGRAG